MPPIELAGASIGHRLDIVSPPTHFRSALAARLVLCFTLE